MTRTRWWLAGALAIGVAGGVVWWLQRGSEAPASYRSAKIERGPLVAAVSSSGTVNPVTQVSVGSQVSGQIKELRADFNTEVKQGQLIARLDPESFEYKVRQANADLESSRAAVLNAQANVVAVMAGVSKARLEADNAQRDAQRKQDLLAQNFISQAENDNARNTAGSLAESLKVAQAQLEVAKAQAVAAQAVVRQREAALSQARVDLERTEIRSPVDGVVIKRSVDVGQTVAASLQAPELFIIARNLQDMQVDASIDEADIARIRLQQPVTFTIDAFPGRNFEGRVNQIRKAALSTQNVVTYTVVVAFANPGGAVLPGMTANVRVVTDTRDNVLKLPNAALRVRLPGVEPAAAASAPNDGASAAPAAPAAAASGGAGGGPLAELRQRLVSELAPSEAQLARIDAVIAQARPRFGELRGLPEDERPKARERILGELRASIADQLDAAQKLRYQQIVAASASRQVTRGRVHTLDAQGRPVAWNVRLGISDGVATELLVTPGTPAAEALREGALVITGTGPASGAAKPASGGPRPMF
ncbi:MAG: efflux RND transporter periplasmic adaptor subunit [Piscinibacter sp.]